MMGGVGLWWLGCGVGGVCRVVFELVLGWWCVVCEGVCLVECLGFMWVE